ncbi:hypothetical protein Tco_0551944 [Tanacetum coccineum]
MPSNLYLEEKTNSKDAKIYLEATFEGLCNQLRKASQRLRQEGEEAWNSGNKDGSKEQGKKEDSKALVTIDGEGVDWTSHSEEDEDYALMACNSSESDTEREQLSDASIEIKAYSQGLKKVEDKCQPKVWSDAPIIEEYESDSEDEYKRMLEKLISPMGGNRKSSERDDKANIGTIGKE